MLTPKVAVKEVKINIVRGDRLRTVPLPSLVRLMSEKKSARQINLCRTKTGRRFIFLSDFFHSRIGLRWKRGIFVVWGEGKDCIVKRVCNLHVLVPRLFAKTFGQVSCSSAVEHLHGNMEGDGHLFNSSQGPRFLCPTFTTNDFNIFHYFVLLVLKGEGALSTKPRSHSR